MTNEQVKQNVTPETVVEEIPVVETAPETTVEETQTVETTPKPTLIGTVFNCAKLNIRKEPKMGAEVLTVVKAGTKLKVDTDNSTDEWYQVTTKDKVAGFCMKEYIKLP